MTFQRLLWHEKWRRYDHYLVLLSIVLRQIPKKDSCVSQSLDTTKSDNSPDGGKMNTNKTENKPQQTRKPKCKNVVLNSQAKNKSDQRSNRGHNTNPNSLDNDETIDLTTDSQKKINQPTLFLGSSILKGIKIETLSKLQQ